MSNNRPNCGIGGSEEESTNKAAESHCRDPKIPAEHRKTRQNVINLRNLWKGRRKKTRVTIIDKLGGV